MEYVKVCPHCGSTDVTIPPAGQDLIMTISDFCQKCKNRGIFPEVEKEKLGTFRNQLTPSLSRGGRARRRTRRGSP